MDVFERLHERSKTVDAKELASAADVLSEVLGTGLELYSFGEGTVTYKTDRDTYVRSSYNTPRKSVVFENIEEIVVDEKSEEDVSRKTLADMVEAIVAGDKVRADELFTAYIESANIKRKFKEKFNAEKVKEKIKKNLPPWLAKIKKKDNKKDNKKKKIVIKKKKVVREWYDLCENVFNYLTYKEYGPVLSESGVKQDSNGNVVALKIPDSKARNEAKVLSFNWKTLSTEIQVLRNKVKTEAKTSAFARGTSDLRDANAASDFAKTEQVIEKFVNRFPGIIYLTQKELSQALGESLQSLGITQFDDNITSFLAEGLLRKATEAFAPKVEKILKASGAVRDKDADFYESFQDAAKVFYSKLDEETRKESQVFVDLYNAVAEAHKIATAERNDMLRNEANILLKDLYDVVRNGAQPNLELANEAAEWLLDLVETNLETSDWDVSNTPYITVNGDNPEMEKKARKSYNPAQDFSGDWGDPAPVSDGSSYKSGGADEMRNHAWGNIGTGFDVYPTLQNPYVPKDNGVWTMKEPNAVTDPNPTGEKQGDTWPTLQNPYVPKGVTSQSYKMKSDDLVVDQ
jgi:hypothetical protein